MDLRRACLLLGLAMGACNGGTDSAPDARVADGASSGLDAGPGAFRADRIWQSSDTLCVYASPIAVRSQGDDLILSMSVIGELRLIDPDTGEDVWSMQLPAEAPATEIGLLATPVVVDERYVIFGYNHISRDPWTIYGFYAGVLDLETRGLSEEFRPLPITATLPTYDGSGEVEFIPLRAVNRGAIHHVDVPDRELGLVYLSYGNGPSVQPFHGWVFEVDLDAWRAADDAASISGVLLTTAENDCGPEGNPMTMVCGGGVWNAAGPTIDHLPDGSYEIFVPTGNGRVDFDVGAYAHSIMRTGRGLPFDRMCDETACTPFDELDPNRECLESCRNLFVPRLADGEPPLAPESGRCDGLTFFECYGELDADLGANAPVVFTVPGGPRVLVQPGKDGALYLVDADHLGTMVQRLQVMDFCGTPEDPCEASWIGMFVTAPALARIDEDPVVILSGQMGDNTHWSGITAVRVTMDGDAPRMDIEWQVPELDREDVTTVFRYQSGRPVIVQHEGEDYFFVVETRRGFFGRVRGVDPPGYLWGVRVRDGELVVHEPLSGAGQRYAQPLVMGDRIFVNSCAGNGETEGRVDAFELSGS